MAPIARRLLAAPLALLLASGSAPAWGDATVLIPPPAATTTTASPPAATVATPPVAPPAVGAASAAVAVPRPRPHRARVRSRPVAHAAAAGSVTIRNFSFGPATITVNAGETVTWVNDGPTDHTATGSGFDTGTLHKGQSASHTFATAGTFSYHCSLHPFMKGTVTVVASAASTTSGSSSAGAAPSAPTTATVPTGPTLPRTGGDPLPLAVLGAGLLLLGLGLRRRAAR